MTAADMHDDGRAGQRTTERPRPRLVRRRARGLSQAARADRAVPRLLLRPAARAVRLDAAGLDAREPASISAPSGCSRWSARPTPIKFLWAPLVDALDVPVLSRWLGRRRGWLVFSQLLLMAAIVLARRCCDPAASPALVALGALLVADRVRHAGHRRSTRSASRACPRTSRPPAWRPMWRPIASACWSRPRARCSWSADFKALGFGTRTAPGARATCVMAALVLIGIGDDAGRDRAGASSRPQPKRACTRVRTAARASLERRSARSRISSRAMHRIALVVLAFVVLFKFTDALAGAMTAPFVIDLGFSRNEYAAIIKGVGLRRDAARRLCRRLCRARLSAGDEPVDRRHPAGGRQSRVLLAGRRRPRHRLAHLRDHGREFHQRDRHGDLRRLPVGAVPQSAAHRDAIRAADRARRGRPHVSVVRRGYVAQATGWVWFFAICALAGDAEPAAARLAAAARAFRGAAATEARALITTASSVRTS